MQHLLRSYLPLITAIALLALPGCSDDGGTVDLDGPRPPFDLPPGSEPWKEHDGPVDPPVTLTVATWNMHDVFDEFDDAAKQDTVSTATEVKAKLSKLGTALRLLKADVLAVQEVENRAILDRLNKDELSSLGYKHVRLVEGNDPRGIDVALLSRFPIPKAASHIQDRFQGVDGDTTWYAFSRDCLEATIDVAAGRQLILLINHLRAWEGSDSLPRRHAQANRVRQIVDGVLKYYPNANLAVVGDLNDTPESKTVSLILNGTPKLVDLMTSVTLAERYTTYFSSTKRQLDYIIASPGLSADLISGSVQSPHSSTYKDASDHYPVTARFVLK